MKLRRRGANVSSNIPRVGISLSLQGESPQNVLDLAREADEAGLYALGAGDASSDTFTMLSACAAVTRQIRLISTVATWTRTPLTTARAVRSLDTLSNGRYTMGLGSMPANYNENHHGIPYESPLQRMAEYMELIRLFWEAAPGTHVDYNGSFYRVSHYRASAPLLGRRIPILVAATRPRAIRWVGERADGIIFNSMHSVSWLQTIGVPILREGAQRGGRSLQDLERGVTLHAMVTDDLEQGRAVMRRRIAPHMTLAYDLEWLRSAGFEEEAAASEAAMAEGNSNSVTAAISDRLVDSTTLIGTPEQCRERIAQYAGLVDWIVIHPQPGSSPAQAAQEVRLLIKAFGDK
ncbi:MAG: LLM class flavin-dependent oxidoreductase [Chloroflexi bacterium]|nr:LLM class flavin-dependent oxidoreductase [Chloroflexota bacterium]